MIIAKCPRCGREREVSYREANAKIKCSHCNYVMKLSKKTEKKLMVAKILYAAAVIFLISFIYTFFKESVTSIASIAIIVIGGILTAGSSDAAGKWLVYRFFGFEYDQN